jgi:hypothetical protein
MAKINVMFVVVASITLVIVVGEFELASGAQTWGRLSNNGYEGVLVAISDRVPEEQCHQVVSNLKVSLKT